MMKLVSAQDFDLRREVEYGSPEQNEAVKAIVQAVKAEGDAALLRYTEQFDGMKLEASGLRVTKEELEAAYAAVEPTFVTAIRGRPRTSGRSTPGRSATPGWICSRMGACWDKSSAR